jgi:N-acetylglucosamine-6-phosphate deacetylase
MMSTTPAKLIGMTDRGEITVGKRADFTIFDGEINVHSVVSGGKSIYTR